MTHREVNYFFTNKNCYIIIMYYNYIPLFEYKNLETRDEKSLNITKL